MHTHELEAANTCSCGQVVLLATDRTTGRTLCTGSYLDETAGVYHTRYGCRPAHEHRGPCCGVVLCDECRRIDDGTHAAIARAELVNERRMGGGAR